MKRNRVSSDEFRDVLPRSIGHTSPIYSPKNSEGRNLYRLELYIFTLKLKLF